VVEKRATYGGTCLNIGCIPSKALLHASELFDDAGHTFGKMGIGVSPPKLDLAAMMAFKDQGVDGNVKGVDFLFRKNKIEAFHGSARIAAPGKVEVTGADGKKQTLEAKSIVIATGSDVARLKGIEIDERRIVSSTGALSLPEVPKHLLVVGAGVIGLELGSVWRRLGAQVTVVEFLDGVLPGTDAEVRRQAQRLFEKQGMTFKLSSKVTAVDASGKRLKATIEPAKGGAAETIEADIVLVAIGRVAYTDGLGLKELGVKVDERGRVVVDHYYATSVPGVWAIGDVIAGPMLAHKAEDEGVALAEILVGEAGHVNYDAIPNVIYTYPEIATVGKSEEELKAAGVAYNVGKFPFTANARAKVNLTTDGFVKIIADAKTDRVLGVHLICADAGNMIAEAVLAMEFGASAEDIARTCHAHPTLPEAVKEAAMAVAKRAIHM
jgi:dihydrolipoamide dehydrogenase